MRYGSLFLVLGGLLFFFSSISALSTELNEPTVTKLESAVRKLQVVPVENIGSGKDFCEVTHTGPPVWCIEDWIQGGQEFYASYQDPLEVGCIDPFPFQVLEIYFMLCATKACTTEIYVDLMEANLDDPACPFPALGVFTSDFYTLEIPGPGNYLVNVPIEEQVCLEGPYFAGFCFPEPVEGLGPITDDTPDGCQSYIWLETDALDLVTPPFAFPGNIILYSTGLTAAQNRCGEYPSPLPVIIEPNDTSWYDQTYFSDSVTVSVLDISEGSKIDHTTFEYMDPSGIWHLIGIDYDGTDIWINSWDSTQLGGDGWSYVWVADSLEEDYYLIRATMTDSLGRFASDTVIIYFDPVPPTPTIIQPGSTGTYCSPLNVVFNLEGDHIAEIQGMVYNFSDGWYKRVNGSDSTYNKGIPSMKQKDLYKWGKNNKGQAVNSGCCPTAGAACLKWWETHGFPGITKGLNDTDLVNALAGKRYMKTNPGSGTQASRVKYGLDRWIWDTLGVCVFKDVRIEKPKNWVKFFNLYASELKKEDILIGWSGKPWHATTGNSVTAKSMTYDVMNPATGAIETYKWPKGHGNSGIFTMWILSPKVQPQPPPATPVPSPTKQSDNEYRILWTPDTTETPFNKWYTFEVTVTDSLDHVGKDLFFFELADYVCGDANGDGQTTISDVVYMISYLFKGGPEPDPIESANVNCEGEVTIADVVYLINYLFKNGDAPCSG